MKTPESTSRSPSLDIEAIKEKVYRPKRAVITGGMPYANGPLHLGHLAGAHLPADIYARWMGMLIGAENVFSSTAPTIMARPARFAGGSGRDPIRQFIDGIHAEAAADPGALRHRRRRLHRHLAARELSDPEGAGDFFRPPARQRHAGKAHQPAVVRPPAQSLPAPTASCGAPAPTRSATTTAPTATSAIAAATSTSRPRSSTPKRARPTPRRRCATPSTGSWTCGRCRRACADWSQGQEEAWRPPVIADSVRRCCRRCASTASTRPVQGAQGHAPHAQEQVRAREEGGGPVREQGRSMKSGQRLRCAGRNPVDLDDEWAHRSITRDIAWGVPVPASIRTGGQDPLRLARLADCPHLVLEGGAGRRRAWTRSLRRVLARPRRGSPVPGAGQRLSSTCSCRGRCGWGRRPIHSAARRGRVAADRHRQRLPPPGVGREDEQEPRQLLMAAISCWTRKATRRTRFATTWRCWGCRRSRRTSISATWTSATVSWPVRSTPPSNADLGGALEVRRARPRRCAGRKVLSDTVRMVQRYVKSMDRADYPNMLFEVENYARTINSLFTQYKPHDDRHPEEPRRNALCSALLRAEEPDDHALSFRARDHGPAAGVAAPAGKSSGSTSWGVRSRPGMPLGKNSNFSRPFLMPREKKRD